MAISSERFCRMNESYNLCIHDSLARKTLYNAVCRHCGERTAGAGIFTDTAYTFNWKCVDVGIRLQNDVLSRPCTNRKSGLSRWLELLPNKWVETSFGVLRCTIQQIYMTKECKSGVEKLKIRLAFLRLSKIIEHICWTCIVYFNIHDNIWANAQIGLFEQQTVEAHNRFHYLG